MERHRITSTADALAFVLGGNAIFTVESGKTGTRFTYRVRKPKEDSPHFVQLLRGPDNAADYSFLGSIFDGKTYHHGRKSKIGQDAPSAKAWAWLWQLLVSGKPMPDLLGFWHEGRCARCGRELTVPSSLATGFGPECAHKMGVAMVNTTPQLQASAA